MSAAGSLSVHVLSHPKNRRLHSYGGNCSLPAPESYVREHMADEAADGDGLGGLMGLHMDSSYPWSWTSQEEAEASGQPWPHPTQRIFCNFGLHQM